jgi:poly-beta-hydroxyalkanoate depolymerase
VLDGGRTIAVHEEEISATPFCGLLHFRKETSAVQPKVLVVAPMSGHFATLLRGTVKTLLRDHDVYITDWRNARDVALEHGRFGLDEYVSHVIDFLGVLGPGRTCWRCASRPWPRSAAAVMAEDNHPAQPRTMTLMAGPLDTRVNPTAVNALAKSKPISWFEKNMISTVPARHAGAGRRVYPGFVQLGLHEHEPEPPCRRLPQAVSPPGGGRRGAGRADQGFLRRVFRHGGPAGRVLPRNGAHGLPGTCAAAGQADLSRARGRSARHPRTALFTIEGEKDDICAVGQTVAAQEMCSNIRPYMRLHHVQTAVGHYGVFNGRRWDNEIYPRLRDFINMHHR